MVRTWPELNAAAENLLGRRDKLRQFVSMESKERRLAELDGEMAKPGFWDSQTQSQKIIGESSRLKKSLQPLKNLDGSLDELVAYLELLRESGDDGSSNDFAAVDKLCEELEASMDGVELVSFLCGPHDCCNAIVSLHSGAGGTEACDWAEMLMRMYFRWAERRNFTVEVEDVQAGDCAGISRLTFRLVGDGAYGYAKAERGVHRLVRISPFDANRRRHTSFCSVDVLAEIEDDGVVEINEEDLRVDTYRSSGKGGQHVNKTESAVRLTHMPTGIVVTCQNERSQVKNRASAMRILRARIYERMQDEKRSAMEKFYGEKGEIGWGYQIRSYVMQPYQMVKDLRTGHSTGNVQAVMDGDIDEFINAWLRAGCPTTRRSSTAEDLDE
ncbi:MAG: peptide chain release factor 2 [Puniceicoccales bacterium]|nr:peptide chain release factor 2 [Puniceicoccales bacterium]